MKTRRFLAVQLSVIVWLVGLAMVASPVLAGEPPCPMPKGPPAISNVFLDFGRSVMTIIGTNFISSNCLKIQLGAPGLEGDITGLCTTTSPQSIACDFSGVGMPQTGDYRLIIALAKYPTWAGQYDLTIGAVGPPGPIGPQGPPGNSSLANQFCPSGEFVVGFDVNGNIVCSSPTPTPPQTTCPNHLFTFSMTSSTGSTFSGASWPGGQVTLSDPSNSGCSVTVARPSGNVSITGLLGDHWYIVSFAGYSNCAGSDGEDGDGVATPNCSGLTLSSGYVQDHRPSCSNSLCTFCSGHAYDNYYVQCLQ
jgi:hypothetical protein